MTLFRRRVPLVVSAPAVIPVPRATIDGWTLSATPLAAVMAAHLPRQDVRELETLLHGIAVEADTPYTYDRAAALLERCDEAAVALAVCDAWLAHPASAWPEHVHHTRAIARHGTRLRGRVARQPVAVPTG